MLFFKSPISLSNLEKSIIGGGETLISKSAKGLLVFPGTPSLLPLTILKTVAFLLPIAWISSISITSLSPSNSSKISFIVNLVGIDKAELIAAAAENNKGWFNKGLSTPYLIKIYLTIMLIKTLQIKHILNIIHQYL